MNSFNKRKSGRQVGKPVEVRPHLLYGTPEEHASAIAHFDLTDHAPLDYPPTEPPMPSHAELHSDVVFVLLCKLYHLNNYRKDLIKRDASAEDVTEPYGDATNEADICLAKMHAIANLTLTVTNFPTDSEIQQLSQAMTQMETAIANSANLTTLMNFADSVIQTIPAHNIR